MCVCVCIAYKNWLLEMLSSFSRVREVIHLQISKALHWIVAVISTEEYNTHRAPTYVGKALTKLLSLARKMVRFVAELTASRFSIPYQQKKEKNWGEGGDVQSGREPLNWLREKSSISHLFEPSKLRGMLFSNYSTVNRDASRKQKCSYVIVINKQDPHRIVVPIRACTVAGQWAGELTVALV